MKHQYCCSKIAWRETQTARSCPFFERLASDTYRKAPNALVLTFSANDRLTGLPLLPSTAHANWPLDLHYRLAVHSLSPDGIPEKLDYWFKMS